MPTSYLLAALENDFDNIQMTGCEQELKIEGTKLEEDLKVINSEVEVETPTVFDAQPILETQ